MGNPKLTDEQEHVLEQLFQQKLVIVNALAGTGKTTTCLEALKHAAGKKKRTIYLVFNKAMQVEASQRLNGSIPPDAARINTVHGFAYRSIKNLRLNIPLNVGSIRTKDVAICCGINTTAAFWVLRFFNEYLYSKYNDLRSFYENSIEKNPFYRKIIEEHSLSVRHLTDLDELIRKGTLPVPHDYYLKQFIIHLSEGKAKVKTDLLILDESQDANPAFAELMKHIDAETKVLVGDRHQWIYAFRGSVNLMEALGNDGKCCYLTTSFRIPSDLTEYANSVLRAKGERYFIRSAGSEPKTCPKKQAVISRTNASLLEYYITLSENSRVKFERGFEEILKLPLTCAAILESVDIRNICTVYRVDGNSLFDPSIIRLFETPKELQEYVETLKNQKTTGDQLDETSSNTKIDETDLIAAVQIAEKMKVSGLMNTYMKYKNYQDKIQDNDVDLYLTTAHSSKGQEYENVRLLDDFRKILDNDTMISIGSNIGQLKAEDIIKAVRSNLPEVNLLYVALTRAGKTMTLSDSVKLNLQDLEFLGGLLKGLENNKHDQKDNTMEVITSNKKKNTRQTEKKNRKLRKKRKQVLPKPDTVQISQPKAIRSRRIR